LKLYPTSSRDRRAVWIGVGNLILVVWLSRIADDFLGYVLVGLNGFWAVLQFVSAYVLQDRPEESAGAEYAEMIDRLDSIGETLRNLSGFLERERLPADEGERTVRRLQLERAALEPVVQTQRETVQAIRSAHATTQRSYAWKERLVGIGLGIIASLVAGIILYVLGVGR